MVRTFVDRVMQMAEARGWMRPRVVEKLRHLRDCGLHPEQLFLGTHVLTFGQYADAVRSISGLPLFRHTIPIEDFSNSVWTHELCDQFHVYPLGVRAHTSVLGHTEPWNTESVERVRLYGQRIESATEHCAMLQSDWRRLRDVRMDHCAPLIHIIHSIQACMMDPETVHVEFWLCADGFHIWLDESVHADEAWILPSWTGSTLLMRLHPWAGKQNWSWLSHVLSDGEHVRCTRPLSWKNTEHPARWSAMIRAFVSHPQGVLFVMRPDQSLKQFLMQHSTSLDDCFDEHRERPRVAWFEGRTRQDEERATHAALAGQPLIVFTDGACRDDAFRSLGVPLTVLESTPTSSGRAWRVKHTLVYTRPA